MKKIINLKNNNKKNIKNGFALLFAVFVSSMILSIALGVLNMTFKEILFSTSSKDGIDAFYAADTASECALYYDSAEEINNAFTGTYGGPTYCNGNIFSIITELPDSRYTFTVYGLGPSSKACAEVILEKTSIPPDVFTKIISIGYSNGGEAPGACTPTETSSQRALELNY